MRARALLLSRRWHSYDEAIAAVSTVDVVVLTLGTDRSVAGEGTDRKDIGLPGIQSQFALAVLAAAHNAKVPVVLLLIHNVRKRCRRVFIGTLSTLCERRPVPCACA